MNKKTKPVTTNEWEVARTKQAAPEAGVADHLADLLRRSSKEREGLLKQLRIAIGSIDAKMVALLSGSPSDVAKRLDAVQGPLLLAVPPKKNKR